MHRKTHAHRGAPQKSSGGELGAEHEIPLTYLFSRTSDFSAFSCEGSTHSIITDRETRAEPSNRDRHDGIRSCQGARRGGKCLLRSRNVMLDGMMCFDDETTCRMVTFGQDGICNSLLNYKLFSSMECDQTMRVRRVINTSRWETVSGLGVLPLCADVVATGGLFTGLELAHYCFPQNSKAYWKIVINQLTATCRAQTSSMPSILPRKESLSNDFTRKNSTVSQGYTR